MRLIDGDALKEYIDYGHLRDPGELCFSEIDFVELIDAQPTIDAVQVIRCKDCKHHCEQYGNGYCMKDGCYGWCDEDYCSRAERRGEDAKRKS